MTKKKFLAALSTAAITTSLLATTAFADNWNTNGGTETGEGSGTVRVPVIEVEVPVELPFAVNPYKLNLAEEGATAITDQIWSDNYMIINHSEVPVAVKTASKATPSADIELATALKIDSNTKKYVHSSDSSKKSAFLGMQFAKTVEFKSDAYEIKYDYTAWTPADGDDKTKLQAIGGLLLNDGASATEDAMVILNNETESNTTGGKNAAAFKYTGFLNDSATAAYTDEDLKVTTVYTLTVLANGDIKADGTIDGYTATTATDNAGTAWNAFKTATASP